MTPAQRAYDIDLAKSMRVRAKWIAPRSLKVSQTLVLGAQRIEALTAEQSIENAQPASTPAKTGEG